MRVRVEVRVGSYLGNAVVERGARDRVRVRVRVRARARARVRVGLVL